MAEQNRSAAQRMFFEFEMSLCQWSNPVYGIISIPSIVLNGLALFLLFGIKKKKPMVHFLLSLSLADIIYPVINVFDIVRDPTCFHRYNDRYYVREISFEKITLVVTSTMQFLGCYAMLGTMLGMTTDRIIAVLRPLRHMQVVTSGRVRTSIFVIWIISVFLSTIHFLLGVGPVMDDNNEQMNISYIGRVELTLLNVTLPMLFTTACVTLAFLVGVYGLIFYQIRQTVHSVSKVQSTSMMKSCVTIVLIVGTFACSWMPYAISTFWYTQNPCPFPSPEYNACYKTMRYWSEITMALVYLNAFFDPMIYIVRDNYVNTAWKQLLVKWGICSQFANGWSNKRERNNSSEMTSLRYNDSICSKACPKVT